MGEINVEKSKEIKFDAETKSFFFEQYKIIIQSVEKNSDRRNIANKFYFSLNTLLITSITY